MFDIPIFEHGFEQNNRDYYFVVETATKKQIGKFKLVFTHCFQMSYKSKFIGDDQGLKLLKNSWDDFFTEQLESQGQNSYWWGQRFTIAYPGFKQNEGDKIAQYISEKTGKSMYSIILETEIYIIEFIFHDFSYELINPSPS